MTAHERYARALREAAAAYEEAHCGRAKKVRRRGPLPLSDEERALPTDPEIAARVERKLIANGYRHR